MRTRKTTRNNQRSLPVQQGAIKSTSMIWYDPTLAGTVNVGDVVQ